MSTGTKSAKPVANAVDSLTFEEALKKLETTVEAMEAGDLSLEMLLNRFEEGTHLAKICQAKLAEAELKIQQLEKTSAGELKLKPSSPELSETDD
jgi:exodeoxyribonuclease VII small subunit